MTDNIIRFPGVSDLPLDQSDYIERRDAARTQCAEECADECLEAVMAIAANYGLLTRQDKIYTKDIVGISEMIKSTFLRYSEIYHPMQHVVDEVLELQELGEGEMPYAEEDDEPFAVEGVDVGL